MRRLLDWWLSELVALVPEQVKTFLDPPARETRVVVDRIDDAALEALAQATDPGAVVLEFAPSLLLRRELELPAVARQDYRQIIDLQIDRLLPMPRAAMCYDSIADDELNGDGELVVTIAALRKDYADRAVAAFARIDSTVTRLLGRDPNGEPRFRLLNPGRVTRARTHRTSMIMAGALVALFVLLLFSYYGKLVDREAFLNATMAEISERARHAETMRRELEDYSQARSVYESWLNDPRFEDVIVALTGLLPDDTWLYEYDQTGDQIVIAGWTPNTSEIVRLLAGSGSFRNVTSTASVATDRGGNVRERFNISLELASAGQSTPAAVSQ